MKENWVEKYENKEDKKREAELNNKLNKLLEQLDEAYNDEDRRKILEEIVCVTDSLIKESFDCDKTSELNAKKELAEIKYKELKEKQETTKENNSWGQFKEEEQYKDEREQ